MRSPSVRKSTTASANAQRGLLVSVGLLFGLLLGGVGLIGCPRVPIDLERPFPRVRAVSLDSASDTGLHARIDLTVSNTNAVALTLRAVDWELSIGDSGPIRGRTDGNTAIPATRSAAVGVSVFVAPGNASAMIARLASGDRSYRLRAVLHFESQRGDIAATVDVTGELVTPPR